MRTYVLAMRTHIAASKVAAIIVPFIVLLAALEVSSVVEMAIVPLVEILGWE